MTLKHYWKKSLRAVNTLKLRERQLITVTSSAIVVAAFFTVSWQPLYVSWQNSSSNIISVQNQIDKMRVQIIETKKSSEKDANQPYRLKVDRLHKNILDQQAKIETITAALINPKYMNQVLSTLLQSSELEINKVNNKPAESVDIKGQSEPANLLYKHGLSLEMIGTFNNSLKYLKRVENQDWHLYWDELVFTTLKYPHGVLTLDVHTLSTSDHVLGL